MPVAERLSPDAILTATNYTAGYNVSSIQDDPDSYDANWLIAAGTGLTTTLEVSFPTPGGPPTGTQQFKVVARITSGSYAGLYPVLAMYVYEGSTLRATMSPTVSISSATGNVVSFSWNASVLSDPTAADVRCRVVITYASSGKNRAAGEVGAVEWNATVAMDSPQAGHFAGLEPNVTPPRRLHTPGLIDARSLGYFNWRQSGVEIWFHADDAASKTAFGSGSIDSWYDDSGNARHIGLASGLYTSPAHIIVNRPYHDLAAANMNGNDTFRIAPRYSGGYLDFGLYGTPFSMAYGPCVFAMVWRVNNTGTQYSAGINAFQPFAVDISTMLPKVAYTAGVSTPSVPAYGILPLPYDQVNLTFVEFGQDPASVYWRYWLNGKYYGQYHATSDVFGVGVTINQTTQIGENYMATNSNIAAVYFAEWMIYSGRFPETWRRRLMWQLAGKYGITLGD